MKASAATVDPLQPWSKDHVIAIPSDKSLTHRAILFASMATGQTDIKKPLLSQDCLATVNAMRALGVDINVDDDGGVINVVSKGWDTWRCDPHTVIDCENSGTTARLLTGLLAATPGLQLTLTGDASLQKRPMGRVVIPLQSIGAEIDSSDAHLLPLTIKGKKLSPGKHLVDKASAQVKSALLLAGLNIDGQTEVQLPAGSRDHTEKMLASMGAKIEVSGIPGRETVAVYGPWRPRAGSWFIPADPSSAAFFAVLAVLADSPLVLPGVLANPTRTGFIKVLQRMGNHVALRPSQKMDAFIEPTCDILLTSSGELRAVEILANELPSLIDEIPILAVAAAFAKGPSVFRGLAELRVKESDRLVMTAKLLAAAGCEVNIEGDDLMIAGGLTQARAFCFDCAGDHRLAMAAAVMASFAAGPCVINDAAAVGVSFPGFFAALHSLRA